ncbi:MAG: hypothetical protein AAF603_03515 [Pseudomonadota bacterium]
MLTDIFAYRYRERKVWKEFGESERRLLVQGFRIISEQIFPYWNDGKEIAGAKEKWESLNKALSMEFGLKNLSPPVISYPTTWKGNTTYQTYTPSKDRLCETFVLAEYDGTTAADVFIKERISFIELAFRTREQEIAHENNSLPARLAEIEREKENPSVPRMGIRLPGSKATWLKKLNKNINDGFRAACDELNTRLRQSGTPLHYHNGFLQFSEDALVQDFVEQPFWKLVGDPIWSNVDLDIKEAIDLFDNDGRDPAWYSARALESTIKIISDQKNWTTGNEKGAINFIENLGSKKNGQFIDEWERAQLIHFYRSVRNPFGHGPGSQPMPQLARQQSAWVISYCMAWITSLIRRI